MSVRDLLLPFSIGIAFVAGATDPARADGAASSGRQASPMPTVVAQSHVVFGKGHASAESLATRSQAA
jgi:hypothetical protein